MSQELEHKLDQAIRDQALQADYANAEIVRIKAELAALDEPKLRHGDQFHDGCNAVTVFECDNEWMIFYPSGGRNIRPNAERAMSFLSGLGYVFVCNIFDDSKRNSKDFEDVKIFYTNIHLDSVGDLVLRGDGGAGSLLITKEYIAEFAKIIAHAAAHVARKEK